MLTRGLSFLAVISCLAQSAESIHHIVGHLGGEGLGIGYRPSPPDTFFMRNRICTLIIALATSIRCAGSQLGPAWQSLAEDARKLGQQGFYAEAMPLYRAALEEAERLTAPPFQVLPLLRGLALAYHEL